MNESGGTHNEHLKTYNEHLKTFNEHLITFNGHLKTLMKLYNYFSEEKMSHQVIGGCEIFAFNNYTT